jgi:hypothetical protein
MVLTCGAKKASRWARCQALLWRSIASAVFLMTMPVAGTTGQADPNRPWIAAVRIIRNGEQSGSGIYLTSGLVVTAAHLTAPDAKMSVHIAGAALPATIIKQGVFEETDLTLMSIEQDRLVRNSTLPEIQLCEAPPWPGDPVIVVEHKVLRGPVSSRPSYSLSSIATSSRR